jgi:histidinol-phosphate aminotransferase
MSGIAERLARPEILALDPFDIADPAAGGYGPEAIKLDANENPFPTPADGVLAAGINRYPEPQPKRLRDAMAALYGVGSDNVVITRGADDAIDMLIRAFCRPGRDAIAFCPPTFSAYAHFARLQGASIVEAPLNGSFDFQPDAFVAAVREAGNVKLAFLCSPNNPTGNVIDPADVLNVAAALPDTLIVLDEAYLEFSGLISLAAAAMSRPNLVVLRTLSKAFGLAGARIGAALGHAETVAIAARALPPYPLPSLSTEAALQVLSPSRRALLEERIALLKAERERLAALLANAPTVRRVRSGGGNFLFLEVDAPEALEARLRGLGVRVRFRPQAAPGGLRLSIGTEAENQVALRAFGIVEPTRPARRGEAVRDTKETRIAVAIDLDRAAPRRIDTGIGFFDHMLDQVAAHGGFSLVLGCEGDLEIDPHHSIEDCAIAFGGALSSALGDRRGIGRFGFSLPMDEAEAHVLIDLSGRPFSRFEGSFESEAIGAWPTQMTEHVFRSIADTLGANIHVRVEGANDHHKTEAAFKAFGRALRQAISRSDRDDVLPSTKGRL